MTAQRTLPFERVCTAADTPVVVDRAARTVTWTTPGHKPVTMLAEDARAFAVGVLMGVRRVVGT